MKSTNMYSYERSAKSREEKKAMMKAIFYLEKHI